THGVAASGDLKMVPLTDRLVRLGPGGGGGPQLGRRFGVGADAVHLAGANRPAPDVYLVAAGAAHVDAGVGVGQGQAQFLALDIACVRAVGQDVGDVRVEERGLLDAPVHLQDEVAELGLRPQTLVALGRALGVVVDDAVDDFPVSAVAL